MTSLVKRLNTLLNEKEEEIERLKSELEQLRDSLSDEESEDDGALPVPRLELAYAPKDDWRRYEVTYRLVMKHLRGNLVMVMLGRAAIDSGFSNTEPSDLPFRDGCHAHHDAGHLQLPLYKLMPGKDPELLGHDGYGTQLNIGKAARREVER